MLRKGSQKPTFSTVTTWHHTFGGEVVSLFETYGIEFYPSQKSEMDVYLAREEDGSFSAITICISKPRQNGKSFAARFYSIYMAAVEGRRVLYSAHNGDTAREMFKQMVEFIENTPDFNSVLMPHRQGIYKAKGSEGIYFMGPDGRAGGCIEFQTRTTSGSRGKTYDIIIVDEAQELTESHLAAIKPTTIAASRADERGREPQMIYLGTPPDPKCVGTVFRDYHDRAHAEPNTPIWWMEWAATEIPRDMSDIDSVMEVVYMTNPAMGYRIREKVMVDAMGTTGADTFAREYLGWWTPIHIDARIAIGEAAWDACEVGKGDVPCDGAMALGVKMSPDGTYAVVAVCVAPDSGTDYVEVAKIIDVTKGIAPVVEYATAVTGADFYVVDGRGEAQTVAQAIRGTSKRNAKKTVQPRVADVVAAYAGLCDAVRSHEIAHIAQEVTAQAAKSCTKRPIGKDGGYGFESVGDGDAVVLEAIALARHYAHERATLKRRKRTIARYG